MRAVFARSGKLVCDHFEDLVPGPGQTLVKTLACGICGSDLHALKFMPATPEGQRGVVYGHEFSAEVLDHGPGTKGRFKPGTPVVTFPVVVTPNGMQGLGYSPDYPGGFAERMIVTEANLLEVKNGLPTDHAAMTEPFAVGAHAVAKARLDKDSVCVVVGCGPVGLAVIAGLKAKGYGPVIAADFSPRRRQAAEAMGADVIVDPAVESPHAKWADFGVPIDRAAQGLLRAQGKSWGRPVIFECVGVPGVLQSLIDAAPAGAQIVVAGVCMEADKIMPLGAILKEIEFSFVFAYTPQEFAETLHNLQEGVIDVSTIVTARVGLDEVAGAFEALGDPEKHVKILVDPSL
jgi:threonine dehydrogenase-like Zn-dependent dehydrogenase